MTDANSKGRPHDDVRGEGEVEGDMGPPPPKRLKVSQASSQLQSQSQTTPQTQTQSQSQSHTQVDFGVPSSSSTSSLQQQDSEMEGLEVGAAGVKVVEDDFEKDQRKERAVGILHYTNGANSGFRGTLKHRYTDFQVNEIMPDGTVCHLTDDKAPKRPQKKTSELDPAVSAFVPSSVVKQVVSETDASSTVPAATETISTSKNAPDVKTEDGESVSTNDETKTPEFVVIPEDATRLAEYVTEPFTNEIIAFHQKVISKPDAKAAVFGSIFSPIVDDKGTRGMIHALVRRMFASRIETMSDEQNRIKFFAAPRAPTRGQGPRPDRHQPKQNGQLKGKLGWDELGGPHLHFSLYKENKDTMEVVSFLAKMLRVKPADFSFAGTKDRRAATVQRVSVFKQQADKLASVNRQLRNSRIGNFSYEKKRLELGELAGNLFTITLRDCHFSHETKKLDVSEEVQLAKEVVGTAVTGLKKHGFINYFGLQRFGTFDIGTDYIGMLILQGKFQETVDALLTYSEDTLAKANDIKPNDKIGKDDLARAQALHLFKTTGRAHDAIDLLPRRFAAEVALIRHLGGRNRSADYLGAIQMIGRNLKTMYVHAYQSKVWNVIVSERWARYGAQVIKGDLILIDRAAEKAAAQDEVDENGEIVIHPEGDEVAVNAEDLFDRARPLTTEEAASGKYTIFDIVFPTPGYDMEYPGNDIGDFYKEFMESEEGGRLDPGNMRRSQKDFSLSGSYRKFMATIGDDFSYEVKTYIDEVEQLVETDWEKLQKSRPEKDNASGNDNLQNGGPQNGRGRGGRGDFETRNNSNQNNGRGRGNGRAGFPNNGFSHNEAAAQNRETYKDSPQLNAWKNLPDKLASDDKAAAQAADLAEKTREKVTSAPIIHETWIQTAADNASVLTGQKSTKVIGEGKDRALGNETATPAVKAAAQDANIESKSAMEGADKSDAFSVASTEDSIGGVALGSRKPSTGVMDAEIPALSASAGEASLIEATKEAAPPVETNESAQRTRIAVIVKFSLKSSQYATIALRELMQGVKTYKPDYNSGR